MVISAYNKTIIAYDTQTEDIITIPLIGHKFDVTSIKIFDDIIYSTSVNKKIITW